MTRRPPLVYWIAALGVFTVASLAWATALIPEPVAEQHGLTRAWACQAQVDPARGQLVNLLLDNGTLFAQTDQGILEAIDAETGKRLWTAQVGDRGRHTFAPAANKTLVAVINGSTLYLLNRANGKHLWKTQLEGAPSAGPALSLRRVYAPVADGMIVSYELRPEEAPKESDSAVQSPAPEQTSSTSEPLAAREVLPQDSLRLKQDTVPPLMCRGPGRPMVAPLVTRQNPDEEYVCWTTEQGYLCVGRVDRTRGKDFALLYRLQTDAPISTKPIYISADSGIAGDSGVIIAASQDGYVHAVRERDGNHLWRFSTASPVVDNPVMIGHFVLVANQLGGLFCLNAADMGSQVWWSPDATQVVATGKDRVYAADKIGRLLVLNGKTGTLEDTIATEMLPIKLSNGETDRLYLASKSGLVQCLHETGLSEPLVWRLPAREEFASKAKTAREATDEESTTLSRPPTTGSLSKSTKGDTTKTPGKTKGTGRTTSRRGGATGPGAAPPPTTKKGRQKKGDQGGAAPPGPGGAGPAPGG